MKTKTLSQLTKEHRKIDALLQDAEDLREALIEAENILYEHTVPRKLLSLLADAVNDAEEAVERLERKVEKLDDRIWRLP